VWDERAFFNGYSHTKTVSEVAHRKTERLADAAAQRRKGSYERRERLDAVPPTPARPYRTAQRRERGADDVRAHLDEPGCALCGVPDAPRVLVEIPWTGTRGLRRVCRGPQNTRPPRLRLEDETDRPSTGSVRRAERRRH